MSPGSPLVNGTPHAVSQGTPRAHKKAPLPERYEPGGGPHHRQLNWRPIRCHTAKAKWIAVAVKDRTSRDRAPRIPNVFTLRHAHVTMRDTVGHDRFSHPQTPNEATTRPRHLRDAPPHRPTAPPPPRRRPACRPRPVPVGPHHHRRTRLRHVPRRTARHPHVGEAVASAIAYAVERAYGMHLPPQAHRLAAVGAPRSRRPRAARRKRRQGTPRRRSSPSAAPSPRISGWHATHGRAPTGVSGPFRT